MQPRMSIWLESLLFLSSCPRTVMASEQGKSNSRVLLLLVLGSGAVVLGTKLLLIDLFVTLKCKFFPGSCWLGVDDWRLVLTVYCN